MPKSLDVQQLKITNHPNRRIVHERSRTPDFIPPNPLLRLAQQIIDALMRGFHGWTGSGYSIDDLKALMGVVGAALAELQMLRMRIAQLEGHIRDILENFLTYVAGALDVSKWLQWQQGSGGGWLNIHRDGYAMFSPVANTRDKVAVAIHKVESDTHLQWVSAVLSMPDNRGPLGVIDWPSLSRPAKNRLIARADAANPLSNHVYADITEKDAQIGFVVNGVTTVLGTVKRTMSSGMTYSLNVTEDRTFSLLENSRVILTVVDTAAKSVISSACRSSGFGFIAPDNNSKAGFVASFSTHVKGTSDA